MDSSDISDHFRKQRTRFTSRPILKKAKIKSMSGFTLIEVLVVIAIIGTLAAVVLANVGEGQEKAYEGAARAELDGISDALELYHLDNGAYPSDADRDIPPGVESYLNQKNWPAAPWPSSIYDYDHWTASELAHPPKKEVYQISVRFCDQGDSSSCRFPQNDWVDDGWDMNSAFFYCIEGPCRAHSSEPKNHPGYCAAGSCPGYCQGKCRE